MRKLIVLLALAALVSATAALAKERNVSMIGAPVAPKAGQAWTATIAVKMDGHYTPGKAPAVRLINGAGKAWTASGAPRSGPMTGRVPGACERPATPAGASRERNVTDE